MVRFGSVVRIATRVPPPSRLSVSFRLAHKMTSLPKSESEWRAVLSPEQFRVLRQKGTERAGTGAYDKHYDHGVYCCAGCQAPLYKSTSKFDSGCGWPAFFEAFPGAIDRHDDFSFGMRRTEITCKNCGGHLGHVFYGEGFPTPTDERHCVNSISLSFHKEDQ
ncbi:Peptide methionine sulfoxide reductase B2, chloroplastic [Malassezia pachydermatis]